MGGMRGRTPAAPVRTVRDGSDRQGRGGHGRWLRHRGGVGRGGLGGRRPPRRGGRSRRRRGRGRGPLDRGERGDARRPRRGGHDGAGALDGVGPRGDRPVLLERRLRDPGRPRGVRRDPPGAVGGARDGPRVRRPRRAALDDRTGRGVPAQHRIGGGPADPGGLARLHDHQARGGGARRVAGHHPPPPGDPGVGPVPAGGADQHRGEQPRCQGVGPGLRRASRRAAHRWRRGGRRRGPAVPRGHRRPSASGCSRTPR